MSFIAVFIFVKGDEGNGVKLRKVQVAPVEANQAVDAVEQSGNIVYKENSMWDEMDDQGVRLGPNGELPEGFRFDEDGNVIVSFTIYP